MTNSHHFQIPIQAILTAMADLLDGASSDVALSLSDLADGNQNAAIGGLVTLEPTLQKTLDLYRAVTALHRLNVPGE